MLLQPLHQDCFDLHPEVRAAWKPSFSKERSTISQPLFQKASLLRRKRSSCFSFALQKRDTSGGTAGWVLCAPIATPLLTPSWEEWARTCWRDDVRGCSYIFLSPKNVLEIVRNAGLLLQNAFSVRSTNPLKRHGFPRLYLWCGTGSSCWKTQVLEADFS